MRRIIIVLFIAMMIALLAGCGGIHKETDLSIPADAPEEPSQNQESTVDSSDELRLNWTILEKLNTPLADILRDEPNLKPQSLDCVDASAMCFVDPSKPYAYILFVTQYLPYDDIAAEAIEKFDIRCAGIYTTVGEMFPDFLEGEHPAAFFDKRDVEIISIKESKDIMDFGIAYDAQFWYKGMLFSVWGGTADSPAVINAMDTVTVGIPTKNEELINNYYNDKAYPDGIGCAEAISRAREYRISQGGSDCEFSIGRGSIIDTRTDMNLPDSKVYIVSPRLDPEAERAENYPVYYVGYTSGKVYATTLA